MKKFYKMFIFALVFAATMSTAILSPLSFKAADAIVFAEAAATASVGAKLAIKGMPTQAVVGQAVEIPSGSTEEDDAVVEAKITNSVGGVVATHSTANDNNPTFAFIPEVAGDYYVVYTATKAGVLTTTSEKFTLSVVQSNAEIEFAENSAFIIPSKIGTNDSVVLPIPSVTEEEEVDDLSGLAISAKTKTEQDVELGEVTIDGKVHKVFTPKKDAQNNVIAGEYNIEYKYNAHGYIATKTFTIKVEEGYSYPSNLTYTLSKTFPTSLELGEKYELPRANVVDKDKNNAQVDVYTVVEIKFGEEKQTVNQDELSFTPMHKATGTDKYTITYKMYDFKALDLAKAENAGKTLAEIAEAATPALTGEYTLSNVEDTNGPKVYAVREYEVAVENEVKTVSEEDAEELKATDYSHLRPSVVRVGQAEVEIPAIYAYDNYSSYGEIAAKRLTRTVKFNGNSYVLENEVVANENLTYTQTDANKIAKVTFLKEGTYEIVYTAEDGAGNVSNSQDRVSYSVKVKAADYKDDVAPYIELPSISKAAQVGQKLSFAAPSVTDYELDHKQNPTSTTIVDAHPETKVYYYLGTWTKTMGQVELDEALNHVDGNLDADPLAFEIQLVDGKYEFEIPAQAGTTGLSIVVRAEDHAKYLVGEQNNVSFAGKVVNIYSNDDQTIPTIVTDLSIVQQQLDLQGANITEQNKTIVVPVVEFADAENGLKQSIMVVDKNGTQIPVGKTNGQFDFKANNAGKYLVTISATDRGGNSVLATLSFDVADISKLSLTAGQQDNKMTLGDKFEIQLPTLRNLSGDVADYETISLAEYAGSNGKAVVAISFDFESYTQPGLYDFDETTWEFTPKAVGTYKFKYLAKGANGLDAIQSISEYSITVEKSTQKPVIHLQEDINMPKYSPLKETVVVDNEETQEYVLIKLPAYNVESKNGLSEKGTGIKVTAPNSENVTVLKFRADNTEIKDTDSDHLYAQVAYYGFKPTYGVGLYTITYTAADIEGLSTTETYNIKVGDTTAPTAEGYTNPEAKTWTVGEDDLSIRLSDITITDYNDVDEEATTVKGNVAINNATGIRLSITLTGPNGEVSTKSTEDSIYVYALSAAGDYTLTYVIKDGAGNQTEKVYNFTVKAVENNTTSAEKAWGIALVVLSVAILAGVIIYFVKTKDADATNLPGKKDDKKDNN